MVNDGFTFSSAFAVHFGPAHFGKGSETALYPRDLIAQIASRGESRDQVRPTETLQIRGFARLGLSCPAEMPLVHSPVDKAAW